MAEPMRAEQLAEEIAPGHYDCEDCFYSCPLSEGCCNEIAPKRCNCGRDELVKKIANTMKAVAADCAAVADKEAAPPPTAQGRSEQITWERGYRQGAKVVGRTIRTRWGLG